MTYYYVSLISYIITFTMSICDMHLEASSKNNARYGSLIVRTKMTINAEISKPGTMITKKWY